MPLGRPAGAVDAAAFGRLLKERGLRVTKEREVILQEVLALRGHFDSDGLFAALRGRGLRVSRASVYRTLPLLVEFGVLEQVEHTAEKHAVYERKAGRGHHDHMLCVSCGRVIEFYSEALERLQQRICREKSFAGISHTLEIKGRCPSCAKKA